MQFPKARIKEIPCGYGGVYMRKLTPARVSHRGDFLIPPLHDDEVNSYRVYLKGHHISIKHKRESKLQIWRI